MISQVSEDGFRFHAVDANDVVLTVSHFSKQASGSDSISQSAIARALLFLPPYMAQILPKTWTDFLLVSLKKTAEFFSIQSFGKGRA